jgi:glycosyltransferase involved in cell wall biosynthesis
VADLHSKLETLIRDPDRVREYERRARAHIADHYSWDTVAEQTEALYREMLKR